MEKTLTKMSVGDLFDRTFRVLGRTFLRNLATGAVALLPGCVLLAVGVRALGGAVGDLILQFDHEMDFAQLFLGKILPSLSVLLLGTLALGLGLLLASLAMMITNAGEAEGTRIEWSDALKKAAGIRLARAIGQSLLYGIAVAGLALVPYSMIILGAMSESLIAVLGVILFLAVIPVIIFLVVRWLFCRVVIAWEGASALESFGRSAHLVGENWWRTFGIMLLFSFVGQFAVSLLTTPVMLIAMWDFYASYFEFLVNARGSDLPPEILAGLIRSLGIGYAILVSLSLLLTTMFEAAYLVLMYFDLRARKGEFRDASQQDAAPQDEMPAGMEFN